MNVIVWMHWCPIALAPAPSGGGEGGVLPGLLLGAAGIVAFGLWARRRPATSSARARSLVVEIPHLDETDDAWASLTDVVRGFDDWLSINRQRPDPWPDFGEFVRSTLVATCQARHIRAYRLLTMDDEQLYPLRLTEPEEHDFPSARAGIIGHVVTSGKSFYASDPAHGALVQALAEEDPGSPANAWCFSIKQNRQTIGVVRVGEMDAATLADRTRLRMIEGIIALCWAVLTETCRSRIAGHTDPISGVLTYRAFIEAAEQSLGDSYAHGEPVAIVNVSVEGLRTLADNGQWDRANQMLFKVTSVLQQRMRADDEIGAFDGSRFLLLLRRVDSELATLIVRQLMDNLAPIFDDRSCDGPGAMAVSVRCGVAGSGLSQPTLRTLIARATAKCREARRQNVSVVSDIAKTQEARHQ